MQSQNSGCILPEMPTATADRETPAMRSHTDVHLSLTPRPDEGDRCAQCDRGFEIGDEVHTQPVTSVRKNDGDPLAFRHYHDGCWLFAKDDIETPAVPRISGFHCLDHDSKASAA